MKILFFILFTLTTFTCFAADNLQVPTGAVGPGILKDSQNRLWNAQVVYTTDGNGNVFPIGGGSGGSLTTSIQGTGGTSPWLFQLTPSQLSTLTPPTSMSISNFPSLQAITSLQLPTALDSSGYLKTHEQGTANVNITNSSVPVTGTFWQPTQPISAASLPLPTNAAQEHTTATAPHSVRLTNGTSFIDPTQIRSLTTADQVTATISGTPNVAVTSSVLPSGAASSANQTTELGYLNNIQSYTGNTSSYLAGAASGAYPLAVTQSGAATASNQTQIDTDLLAFKAANHTDLAAVSTALGSISSSSATAANQTSQISALTAIKTAQADGTQKTQVTNFPSTQTVSGSVGITSLPSIPAGSNAIGSVTVSNLPATQATSSTQLPTALDTNGYLKTHEQGTANVSIQNSSIPVTAASLPLPTNAAQETGGNLATIATNTTGIATSALQTTGNTSLATIATNTTGLATASAQTTGNSSLSSIVSNTTGLAKETGGNLATIATNTTGLATATAQTTGNTSLASIVTNTANIPAKGAALTSASTPVVLATDQVVHPVTTATAQILSNPASLTMAAASVGVTWTVQNGGGYYLSLTNAPAATAAWVATVSFQYSVDNSTWNSLSVVPISTPAVAVTQSTANGLWYVPPQALAGTTSQKLYIRAYTSAWTSGTIYASLAPADKPGTKITMPWTYSVTSGATIMGPIEASGFSNFTVQISAMTTTVLTAQASSDPSFTTYVTLPVQNLITQGASGTTISSASSYRFSPQGHKYVRLVVSTTGTVLTVQGITGTLGFETNLTNIGNDIGVTLNSALLAGTNNIGLVGTGGSTGVANAPVYNLYSTTNITTSAYVQLIASTTSAANFVDIFDSSGQGMILATGASGSEVVLAYIPPGGAQIRVQIAAATRLSMKALTANATSGFLILNLWK